MVFFFFDSVVTHPCVPRAHHVAQMENALGLVDDMKEISGKAHICTLVNSH